jgi:hypothetical protein
MRRKNVRYTIDGVVGELTTLPGCSQIAVSHSVFLPPDKRGQGLGKTANKARKELAFDELGYDVMMCTVNASNIAQTKILLDNGWYCVDSFLSSKTSHVVQIWMTKKGA